MITVKTLNFDAESREADVLLSDGQVEFTCFAYGLKSEEQAELVPGDLWAFNPDNVQGIESAQSKAEKIPNSYYGYRFCGQVINKNTVRVGEFDIHGFKNAMPGDVNPGEWVSFECMRVDF